MSQTENPYATTTENNLIVTSYLDIDQYQYYASFTIIPYIDTTEFGTPENPIYCYAYQDTLNGHSNCGTMIKDVNDPSDNEKIPTLQHGPLMYFDAQSSDKVTYYAANWTGDANSGGAYIKPNSIILNLNNKTHYATYKWGQTASFISDFGLVDDLKYAAENQVPITLTIASKKSNNEDNDEEPENPEDPNNKALTEFVSSLSEAPDEFTIDISQIENMDNYIVIEESGYYYNDYLAIFADSGFNNENDMFSFAVYINKNISDKIKFYLNTSEEEFNPSLLVMSINEIAKDNTVDNNDMNSPFIQLNNTLNSNLLQIIIVGLSTENLPTKFILGFV